MVREVFPYIPGNASFASAAVYTANNKLLGSASRSFETSVISLCVMSEWSEGDLVGSSQLFPGQGGSRVSFSAFIPTGNDGGHFAP